MLSSSVAQNSLQITYKWIMLLLGINSPLFDEGSSIRRDTLVIKLVYDLKVKSEGEIEINQFYEAPSSIAIYGEWVVGLQIRLLQSVLQPTFL